MHPNEMCCACLEPRYMPNYANRVLSIIYGVLDILYYCTAQKLLIHTFIIRIL
jgi:hypothetical protein